MNYYKLITQFDDTRASIAINVNPPKGVEFIYTKEQAPLWGENYLSFELNRRIGKENRDIFRNDLSLPLFSNRLKEELEKNKIMDVSFFKVYFPQEVEDYVFFPYWYAHLPYLNDVFDYKQSEYNWYGNPPRVAGATKVVLHKEGISKSKLDLFRIPEVKPSKYASEKFKKMFEENHFTGVEFLQIKTA